MNARLLLWVMWFLLFVACFACGLSAILNEGILASFMAVCSLALGFGICVLSKFVRTID